jgi:hypothetical protein
MVLGPQGPGRVGRRRFLHSRAARRGGSLRLTATLAALAARTRRGRFHAPRQDPAPRWALASRRASASRLAPRAATGSTRPRLAPTRTSGADERRIDGSPIAPDHPRRARSRRDRPSAPALGRACLGASRRTFVDLYPTKVRLVASGLRFRVSTRHWASQAVAVTRRLMGAFHSMRRSPALRRGLRHFHSMRRPLAPPERPQTVPLDARFTGAALTPCGPSAGGRASPHTPSHDARAALRRPECGGDVAPARPAFPVLPDRVPAGGACQVRRAGRWTGEMHTCARELTAPGRRVRG